MSELDTLKIMLVDLNKTKSVFSRQAAEFDNLQVEIGVLNQRATADPAARKKLYKLNEYMDREGSEAQHKIAERIERSKINLQKLEAQLRLMLPETNQLLKSNDSASEKKTLKRLSRSFA